MEIYSFHTIQSYSEGFYKKSGSKFLAFAYPVASEDEIKSKIGGLKKKYYDATHHCFAWVLGADKAKFRAEDDGEPNHSAGDPILGQIRSKELTNVLVVVVRYFGGTKLGVGGLIQAYKSAAEEALNQATLIEEDVTMNFLVRYPYDETSEVMRLVKDFGTKILKQEYLEDCRLEIQVKQINRSSLLSKMELLQALSHKITFEPV
ncbi:MAG: YigZ family protein [Cyclobacteriaceae bacterium]|nr:YigZ family protein [Cyclobacteriaceae bacterium]